MLITQWASLVLICFLGAATPGPSLLVIMRVALTSGRREGLLAAWCHAAAIGCYAVLSLWVFAGAQMLGSVWFWGLAIAGQCWLLYLGVSTLRSAMRQWTQRHQTQATATPAADHAARWYQGLIIGLLNPKIWLFFTAVFSPFVNTVETTWPLALVPFLIDGIWYTIVVFGLTLSRLANGLQRVRHYFDGTLGLLLCALAVWALTDSLPTLLQLSS